MRTILRPKLKSVDMWVVGHLVGDLFYPVVYTAAYTRKNAIKAFTDNSVSPRGWDYWAWPKGCYAVLKMRAARR